MEDQQVKTPPQFLPKLKDKKITVRLMDGRPIIGILEAYNLYELLLNCNNNKKMLIFKGAISSVEFEGKIMEK